MIGGSVLVLSPEILNWIADPIIFAMTFATVKYIVNQPKFNYSRKRTPESVKTFGCSVCLEEIKLSRSAAGAFRVLENAQCAGGIDCRHAQFTQQQGREAAAVSTEKEIYRLNGSCQRQESRDDLSHKRKLGNRKLRAGKDHQNVIHHVQNEMHTVAH